MPSPRPRDRLYEPVVEQRRGRGGDSGTGARLRPTLPAKLSPLPAEKAGKTVTPYKENKEPLPRGESKNQEPASGGTTGVYISQSESKKTEAPADRPTLRDVKPEDLRDPARLLDLHAQAIAAGYVSSSEADRLNFFAAANHARVIGSRNPPGLFVRIVRSGLWSFLTQDDEDVARVQLRARPLPRGGLGGIAAG